MSEQSGRRAVERTSYGWLLTPICPDEDGLVHDDYANQTPVERINCATCLARIIKRRVEMRAEELSSGAGPKTVAVHTRLVPKHKNGWRRPRKNSGSGGGIWIVIYNRNCPGIPAKKVPSCRKSPWFS